MHTTDNGAPAPQLIIFRSHDKGRQVMLRSLDPHGLALLLLWHVAKMINWMGGIGGKIFGSRTPHGNWAQWDPCTIPDLSWSTSILSCIMTNLKLFIIEILMYKAMHISCDNKRWSIHTVGNKEKLVVGGGRITENFLLVDKWTYKGGAYNRHFF